MKVKFGTLKQINGEDFKNGDNSPILITKAICSLIAKTPVASLSIEDALRRFELFKKLDNLAINEEVNLEPSEITIIEDTIKSSSINILEAGQMLYQLKS